MEITKNDLELLKEKYPNNIEDVLKKIKKQHYPVQYLIGNVDFFDCNIKVNDSVLIPRFETELLVEKALKRIKNLRLSKPNIIDLGCGSGCIGIALKKNLNCNMTALDISEKALNLAKENAIINQAKINFIHQDMVNVNLENYDIIISNPPYVKKNERVGIETKYEPQNAIFAQNEGLYFYEQIIKNIFKLQKKPKLIAFEIGKDQALSIKKLQETYLKKYTFAVEKDYQNRDRFVFLEKNE